MSPDPFDIPQSRTAGSRLLAEYATLAGLIPERQVPPQGGTGCSSASYLCAGGRGGLIAASMAIRVFEDH
ncbi:hypothetical protein [Planctopirus limnophila]|uniref:hypothetical protein n=1 Tax=Planctopirus limnophila TaxID=120 RepID=UPI0011D0A3C7|nr:hypothetical protein [Planctopirus limnophila]